MSPTDPVHPIDTTALKAHQLPLALAGLCLHPGLSLICGDDERMARSFFAFLYTSFELGNGDDFTAGRSVYWHESIPRESDDTSGRAWLDTQAQRYPLWSADLAADLVEALNLEVHIDKPLYMYSLGSARKLNLVAALACGVSITCLEAPFAALDGPSRAVVAEFLTEASEHPERSWLVFDFEKPAALDAACFAQVVTV